MYKFFRKYYLLIQIGILFVYLLLQKFSDIFKRGKMIFMTQNYRRN